MVQGWSQTPEDWFATGSLENFLWGFIMGGYVIEQKVKISLSYVYHRPLLINWRKKKSWENQGRINLLGFDVIKEIYNTWKKLSVSINIHLNVSSSADADTTDACDLKFVILAQVHFYFSEP